MDDQCHSRRGMLTSALAGVFGILLSGRRLAAGVLPAWRRRLPPASVTVAASGKTISRTIMTFDAAGRIISIREDPL